MLTALLYAKDGRIQLPGEDSSTTWREVFKRSEDLLSAVFFGRLRYLSPHSASSVMALLIGPEAATALGELQRIKFWPRFDGTHGRSWVEPDIEIHFANALVLVEVKPPLGGEQYLEQWRFQIHALAKKLAEDSDRPAQVHFVGLGNNTLDLDEETLTRLEVPTTCPLTLHQAEWTAITEALPTLHTGAIASDRAVFDDWSAAFALFGLQPPRFQWPELLQWAQHCGLSTAAVPWPIWSTQLPTYPATQP